MVQGAVSLQHTLAAPLQHALAAAGVGTCDQVWVQSSLLQAVCSLAGSLLPGGRAGPGISAAHQAREALKGVLGSGGRDALGKVCVCGGGLEVTLPLKWRG